VKNFLNRWLAAGILGLVAADWLSKLWIIGRIPLGETRTVIEGWLYLAHRKNPGVAFSMMADLPDAWRTPLLAAVSLLGVVLFAKLMLDTQDRLSRVAAAVVVAGAIGNLGDRLLNGHVTDFVLLSFFPFVFNVADAAITVGGIVLAIRMAFADVTEEVPALAEPTAH
jgi:signal peptidase II